MNEQLKEARYALNTRLFLLFLGFMLMMNALMGTSRYGRSWLQLADEVSKAQEQGLINLDEPMTEEVKETEAAVASEGSTEAASERISEASTEAAAAGTIDVKEVAWQMQKLGISLRDLRLMGIVYIVVSVIELLCGLICIMFSNRVNRANIVFAAVIVLLVGEMVFLIVSAMKGTLMISSLVYSVVIPCILLRQAWKLRKMAKADPDRVYVIEPAGKNAAGGRGGSGRKSKDDGAGSRGERRGSSQTQVSGGKSLHERAMMQAAEEEGLEEDKVMPETDIPAEQTDEKIPVETKEESKE